MARRPAAGLCDACAHQQLVGTTRGSEFSLCRRSKTDARFPKYPPVPVLRCAGFELGAPRAAEGASPQLGAEEP